MSLPQYVPELVAIAVSMAVAVPFQRALRRTSPKATLFASVAVTAVLAAAVFIVLGR